MERILVIDGEKFVSKEIALFLSEKGYQVESAFSGTEGLKKLQLFNPDLVLLDTLMPDIDGVNFLKHIKQMDDPIDVIMITGLSDEDVGKKCLELGAFDYITKPLNLDYLEMSVIAKIALS